MAIFLYFLFTLSITASASTCDRCLHQTKAVLFTNASALSYGACGYGSYAPSFYNGHLAAADPSIFKSGLGCGACFQVKCMDSKLCSNSGTQMIVTDLSNNTRSELVLSSRALMAMANLGMEHKLLKTGSADVEYKRVSCDYKGKNLGVRVEESSDKLHYLAVKLLYQGGQTEIMNVDIAKVGSSNWSFLRRKSGVIWETSRVPDGAMQFRFVVTSGYDRKTIWAKNVLPPNWNVGFVYDSGVQIDDIAQQGCGRCD